MTDYKLDISRVAGADLVQAIYQPHNVRIAVTYKGKDPMLQVFVGGEYEQDTVSGIPFIGSSTEKKWSATAGVRWPFKNINVGGTYTYASEGEGRHTVSMSLRF